MVRLRSASIRSEIFGYASFVNGFSIVSKFHRFLGYSFFSWKNLHGERKYSASVVSPYLGFAVLSWTFFAFVMVQDTYRVVYLVRGEGGKPLRAIDKCVLIFYFVRCLGIQLTNVITLVIYSRDLDEIIKKMEAIESTFQRPTRLRVAAKFIILQNVIFSVAALLSICDEIANFDGYMEPIHMKVIYGVFSLVFAETVCMIGFSWIMYFSRAFASFLRCINEDVESLAVGRPLVRSELAAQHLRFCELWYAFVHCDKIFSTGLLVTIPLNIINASPWGYFILTTRESSVNVIMDVVGFVTFGAELFALGAYGSAAQEEAKKTWDVLTKLLVSQEHTPEVREQIQEFRHTCQNQDFSFSGCGFFKVGPPLIVSIASAIITYTVILYQSDNSSSSTPAAPLNITQA
ncbi:uncharacterized protein [Dermacentor albipictus]|uniref:uncharacterized protein n=1 Tax=Dermacentor albipictus TaxID=60249 RepID=UPI0038FCBC0D